MRQILPRNHVSGHTGVTQRTFFGSSELFEAAEVDGAGPASTFFAIALPLALPGILSVFIFQFIFSWNDLMMPLVLLGASDKATVTIQIAGMVGSTTADNQTLVAASAIVSVIVPLVVFFALQRYFVRGLMSGAVKG